MKKNYLLTMWSKMSVTAAVILLGFNQQAVAQLTGITVSEGDNETWYYIESGHSARTRITSNDGRFGGLISSNGLEEKADLDLLRSTDKRASQSWKVVAADEAGFYRLINKDGEYFHKSADSFHAGTEDPGDAGLFHLVEVPDTKYYTIRRKGRTDDETKLEVRSQADGFDFVESEDSVKVSVAEYGITGSPRSWRFVPIAEIDDVYPEIYPEGTAFEEIDSWYYLKCKGINVSTVPYLTLTETANTFQAKTDADGQLFGFISSGRTTGAQGSPVHIVNKAYANKYVGEGIVPPSPLLGAILGDDAYDWYIGHVVKPVEGGGIQNTIRTDRDGYYLASHVAKIATTVAKSNPFSGDDATQDTYDLNYNWIFEKAGEQPGSSIEPVSANDRLLKAAYYTLQGVLIPSPNRTGVYIVKKTYASGKTETSKIIYTKH